MSTSEYQKQYYRDHPDQYEEQKKRMREYNKKPGVKTKNRECYLKFIEAHPGYQEMKGRKYRAERKYNHLRQSCGKEKLTTRLTLCDKCRLTRSKYYKSYYQRRKTEWQTKHK